MAREHSAFGSSPRHELAGIGVMRPSGKSPFWTPGTQILWRYRRIVPGYVGPETARPVTVVRDDAAGLVAWLAPGTVMLRPVLPDGSELRSVPPLEMFRAERALRRDRWRGTGILMIAPSRAPWSIWLFWRPGWNFHGWYVNLEDPHERDATSVASQDHVLDLQVALDRSVRWKDEDELEAAVIAGRYSADDADRFREDARRVEKIVREWGSPFCDGWEAWRPDPSWPVPDLPTDAVWDFDGLASSAT